MKNLNPFQRNWRICKEIFSYKDFSIIDDENFLVPDENGTLEKKLVYELNELNWFEAIQRWWDCEDCYICHKDNLEQHIPLNEVSRKEIEDAEWLSNKLSRDEFMNRHVTPYFNARRLS